MASFAVWHWLFLLLVLIGLPALVVGLIVRRSRRVPVPNAAAQLRELAQLRERGLVTVAEYERKRAELARHL